MASKKFWAIPLRSYQYISALFPANCRYYPTCSEYAKWSFDMEPSHLALYHSSMRILRCNQLFEGGIDYPLVIYKNQTNLCLKPNLNDNYGTMKIKYWIVPKQKGKNLHYIIKDFDAH